jgi:hypothetical protein
LNINLYIIILSLVETANSVTKAKLYIAPW